jgi:hypothetical protein
VELVSKQVKEKELKSKHFAELPLSEQDFYFASVYGGATAGKYPRVAPGTVLNVMLACEELSRLEATAFSQWLTPLACGAECPAGAKGPSLSPTDEVVRRLAAVLGLAEEQCLYLVHSARAVPRWELLAEQGPWSGDMRAQFLCRCLQEIPRDAGLEPGKFHDTYARFRKLLSEWRRQLPGHFFPESLVLVEGPTEAVLLPHFARLLGKDFQRRGIMVAATGGVKAMLQRYRRLRSACKLSITLVVDADAAGDLKSAAEAAGEKDLLHVWRGGEIEDTFSISMLIEHLNKYLHACGSRSYVSPSDFNPAMRRTATLDRLWRQRGLGDFDKMGFAESLVQGLSDAAQVPEAVASVIESIDRLAAG